MTFAPPAKTKVSSHMAKSSWTPLNNPASNNQVFDERRGIMKKWFEKWQDTQKRVIVGDILQSLSQKHLIELHENLNNKFPQERFDFTKRLPRVLSLYLLSFLDPRTLCRCSQVSWYWNYLTELDCLWRPKCLKFGWYPTYEPTPFEEKIWKRFYVKTVHELNFAKPKNASPKQRQRQIEDGHHRDDPDTSRSLMSRGSSRSHMSMSAVGVKRGPTVASSRRPLPSAQWEPPPWRGSDPNPIDTQRYNYLDNRLKNARNSPRKKKSGSPAAYDKQRPASAMSSARSLNTERSKSTQRALSKLNKTLNTSMNRLGDTTYYEDAVVKRPHTPSGSIRSTQVAGSLRAESEKSKTSKGKEKGDPFEVNNLSRLSIDAGKRPHPVARVDSTAAPKTISRVESSSSSVVAEIEASSPPPPAAATSPADVVKDEETVNVAESTDDIKKRVWKPAESEEDDDDINF